MKHCSECGSRTLKKIPEGDNRERDTCESCERIFYQSSKIVVVCIPEWQGRILLCRRAIEPRRGHWCLPGGYLETGETLEEGASREVYEETFASVENLKLFSKAELIHLNLVMFCFQGKMKNASFRAGQECLKLGFLKCLNCSRWNWPSMRTVFPWKHMLVNLIQEAFIVFGSIRTRSNKFLLV